MNESYWRKTLADGSFEFGKDSDIQRQLASWTRGRQDIIATRIFLSGRNLVLRCVPKEGLATWHQRDNFCANLSSNVTKRLSREVECTTKGCTRLWVTHDMANIYKMTIYDLNNERGELVPEGASSLVCRIGIDGRVDHEWS